MYLILKQSFRLNSICYCYYRNFCFHCKTWNFILLPNLGFCFLEGVTAFLWERLERYIPLIFFSHFTFTCVETHCFWKWRCSGVSCKICISLPQTSGYLLTGCERKRGETACPGASNLGEDAMSQTPSHHSHRCTAYYLKGNKYRPLNVTARTHLLPLN